MLAFADAVTSRPATCGKSRGWNQARLWNVDCLKGIPCDAGSGSKETKIALMELPGGCNLWLKIPSIWLLKEAVKKEQIKKSPA